MKRTIYIPGYAVVGAVAIICFTSWLIVGEIERTKIYNDILKA